jgi:hypothetical protein
MREGIDLRTSIEFPKQFQDPSFRFLCIDPPIAGDPLSGKKPISGKSWKKPGRNANIHTYDSPFFLGWLSRTGRWKANYGVICAYGGLICFDADDLSRFKELGADFTKWPDTFQVKTGRSSGEGFHFYFKSPDLKEKVIFEDPEKVDPRHPNSPLQLGSLQAGTPETPFYVVGPGSLHHSGGTYTIVNDVPIATLTKEQFWDVMNCIPHSKDKKHTAIRAKKAGARVKRENKHEVDNETCNNISSYIKCQDVAMPDPIAKWNGAVAIGSHPLHGSDSGQNFNVDTKKNVWSCFRHHTGGSGLELVAIKHGIIKCDEARKGCLTGDKFWEAVTAAQDDGHEIPDEILEKYLPGAGEHDTSIEIVDNRIDADELPKELPGSKVIAIRGPPRIGKSHWSITQLIKWGTGNYLTHRYSVIEHAVKIFKELGGKSSVVVEGKGRPGMCRIDHPDCKNCKFKPDESRKDEEGQMGYFRLQDVASKLVHNHQVLTKNEVPHEYCPYYVLRFATQTAKYVFTVAQNIDKINIVNRKCTVIDEDPTLNYFFPGSPELARTKMTYSEVHIISNLIHLIHTVDSIILQIDEKKRKSAYDRKLRILLEKIKDIDIEINRMRDRNMSPDDVLDSITRFVKRDYKERAPAEVLEMLHTLDDMYHSEGESDIDLRQVITALLVTYTERPVHRTAASNGYRSLYLIGDARTPLMDMDWVNNSEKIVIIGATLAELFAFKIDDHPTVINISKFKYAQNYVVIPIEHDDQRDKKNIYRRQLAKLRTIVKLVAGAADSDIDRPIIVFTGSKARQSHLACEFGEKSHRAAEGGERAQIKNFKSGHINLAVMNAAISRGLDVDQYGVLALYDSSFSVPLWSAARWVDEYRAKEMLESIIADEATNCALRISPTERSGQTSRPKLILVPSTDLWKLRYIEEQVIEVMKSNGVPFSAEAIAKTIIDNNLTGRIIASEIITEPNEIDLNLRAVWYEAVDEKRLPTLFLEELKENADADLLDLDDKYKQICKYQIVKFLGDKTREAARNVKRVIGLTKTDIKNTISPSIKHSVLRRCIIELVYDGKIKRINRSNVDYYFV